MFTVDKTRKTVNTKERKIRVSRYCRWSTSGSAAQAMKKSLLILFYCKAGTHRSEAAAFLTRRVLPGSVKHVPICRPVWKFRTCNGKCVRCMHRLATDKEIIDTAVLKCQQAWQKVIPGCLTSPPSSTPASRSGSAPATSATTSKAPAMAMKQITPTPPDGPPPEHLRLSSRSSVENKAPEKENDKEKDKEKENDKKKDNDQKRDTEARLSSWDSGWILQSLGSASTSQLAELRSSIDDEMTSRRMTTLTMTSSTSLPSDPTPPWLGPLSHSKAIQDLYDNASQYELLCAQIDPLIFLNQVDEQFAARTRPFKACIGLEEHENAKLRIDGNPDPKGLRFTFPPEWAEEGRVMTCCLYVQHPDGGKKWHLYADRLPIGEFPEMPVMPLLAHC